MHRLPIASTTFSLALLFIAAAGGCSKYHYEITLRPDGDALERQLTCWKESANSHAVEAFPRARLEKIANAYSALPAAKLDQKHSFSGRFVGKMPSDVGGSGTYTRWTSPFGTAATYMERFGGNDDVAKQIEDRRKAANRLIDLGIGWFEIELGREANWNDLRKFLDVQVRHDFESASCLLLVAGAGVREFETDSPSPNKSPVGTNGSLTPWVRLLQYLVERGYVEPRDLPLMARSIDAGPVVPLLDRLVARKLGLADDAPRPAAMAFLASDEAATASLDGYLRTTPEYHKLELAWQERRKENPTDSPPEPTQVVTELFGEAFFKISLEDSTQLKITLVCGESPTATNGIWDADNRRVIWKATENGDQGLPTFLYAMWSVPVSDAQEKQFGKVVLTGENLYTYVLWYRGLSAKETTEWEAFLSALQPGEDLATSLKAFRFSTDPPLPADPKESKPASLADKPRELILAGLSDEP